MIRATATAFFIVALGVGVCGALTAPQQRGRALAERFCAACHAVGSHGASPHVGAPPFRKLDTRLDLDGLAGRLREGLASSHPDMPMFRFSREDANAVVAYLRTIQGR